MSNGSGHFNSNSFPGYWTGYVRTYIILPGTIYGIATGMLYDFGISNPHSIQIPLAIKSSLDRGQGGVVGEGKNIWPHVEVHEREFLYVQSVLVSLTLLKWPNCTKYSLMPHSPIRTLHMVARDITMLKTVNISFTTWQNRTLRCYMTWEKERALIRHPSLLTRFRSTLG
jgi:hypothetical protein